MITKKKDTKNKQELSDYGKRIENIQDESDCCLMLVKKGKRTIVAVKGSPVSISGLLYESFENKFEIYDVAQASVKAYEELQEFRKLNLGEQISELGEKISKLGKELN
ncbi:MAG: hypothetical protein UE295_06500 [Acutalibacteraceae bacterium]|nr:hypothetical protein [Acutalibacteraceae bacterium]